MHPIQRCCVIFTLCCIISFSLGCNGNRVFSAREYVAAIASGRSQMSVPVEMERFFPETDHMIIQYSANSRNRRYEWQTVSYFGGRYELTFITYVTLSRDGSKVESFAEGGHFHLSVVGAARSGSATYVPERNRGFLADVWSEFVAGGGSIAVLDPKFDGTVVEGFDEYAAHIRQPRKLWRSRP